MSGMDSFLHKHQVRWGECDPAGIVYSPNILGYALQAVEAWYESVVGESWTAVMTARGLMTPWVHADIDFRQPMAPGDRITVELRLAELGNASLEFRATATDEEGRELFRARLVSCFVDKATGRPTRVPDDLRRRMVSRP